MSTLRSFALLLILASGMLSCASTATTRPMELEFAEVLEAHAAEGKEFPRSDPAPGSSTHVRLSEPVAFAVERAWETTDDNGHPAVGFELVASEKPRFRAWTAQHLEREMAVVVDGRVRMIAKVMDPLPGVGTISRGEPGFAAEEVREIVAGLQAGAK